MSEKCQQLQKRTAVVTWTGRLAGLTDRFILSGLGGLIASVQIRDDLSAAIESLVHKQSFKFNSNLTIKFKFKKKSNVN